MRIAISFAFALAGFAVLAQTPPPGSIVIRPKGSPEAPTVTSPTTGTPKPIVQLDPDKPGFYVIRPNGRGPVFTPGSGSTSVQLPPPREGVPHLEIIRPKPVDPSELVSTVEWLARTRTSAKAQRN